MQTRIVLLALLSAAPAVAPGQGPTSAAVMRIDPATQRHRDETRAVILQNELVSEALALADAQKLVASPTKTDFRAVEEAAQRIARHRQNISALAKELASAERQAATAPTRSQSVPPFASPQPRKVEDSRLNSSNLPEWLIPAAR